MISYRYPNCEIWKALEDEYTCRKQAADITSRSVQPVVNVIAPSQSQCIVLQVFGFSSLVSFYV